MHATPQITPQGIHTDVCVADFSFIHKTIYKEIHNNRSKTLTNLMLWESLEQKNKTKNKTLVLLQRVTFFICTQKIPKTREFTEG